MGLKRTDEFRADAVRIALTSGLSGKQVASDLVVGLSTLNKWVAAHRDTGVVSDMTRFPEMSSVFVRMAQAMLCYRKCPRLGLDFPPFDHTDGLDASGNFMSAAGTLFPMALCGLSSL